jgi:tRNA pseudouridine38-40 synthase
VSTEGKPLRNIALRLRYDGSAYHGWQVQKTEITVAETLEKVLSRICGEAIKVVGCGRTDAGVHAERYCANFKTVSAIPVDRLPLAANSLLPGDIVITDALEAPEDFNAILSCEKKEYTYRIYNSRIRDPFLEHRVYFFPVELKPDVMRDAAAAFVGTHNFAAVRSVGTDVKSTVRTVHYCDVTRSGCLIELKICADGFLYNMVRAITGTVIYASLGKITPSDIPGFLAAGDRRLTGPTVPPQGLYMTGIWYSGAVGEMLMK